MLALILDEAKLEENEHLTEELTKLPLDTHRFSSFLHLSLSSAKLLTLSAGKDLVVEQELFLVLIEIDCELLLLVFGLQSKLLIHLADLRTSVLRHHDSALGLYLAQVELVLNLFLGLELVKQLVPF